VGFALAILVVAVLALAWANGANDNFKGVATLYGGGILGYRAALALATAATLAGSLAALVLGRALLATFGGKGIVPDGIAGTAPFLAAVALGAGATVLVATRVGLPISTTHALVGALTGSGLVAAGGDVDLARLGGVVAAPLLFAPLVAAGLGAAGWGGMSGIRRRLGIEAESCVCVGEEWVPMAEAPAAVVARVTSISVGRAPGCRIRYQGAVLGIEAAPAVDALHAVSAAAVCFARGVNDTPKILALLLAGGAVAPSLGLTGVAVAMAIGGIVAARRVAETMSHGIAELNPGRAFAGNLATAFLVLVASRWGLPVSTTHVSAGSLMGVGAATGHARWGTIRSIALSWVATVPLAAALGALAAVVL